MTFCYLECRFLDPMILLCRTRRQELGIFFQVVKIVEANYRTANGHNGAGDDDNGDGGGGRIFPEHPSPILHAPRDNISRKGNPSLR